MIDEDYIACVQSQIEMLKVDRDDWKTKFELLKRENDKLKDKIYDLNVYIAELENADVEYRKEIKELKEQIKEQTKQIGAKDTPLAVVNTRHIGSAITLCPTCKCFLYDSDWGLPCKKINRCSCCGQKLDWRDW